jgi:hypothetical protein
MRTALLALIKEQSELQPMNRTLLLANAMALVILAGSQLIPEERAAEPVAQRMPHYLQVQRTPQWAVLSDQSDAASQMVSEPDQASTPATERLVF